MMQLILSSMTFSGKVRGVMVKSWDISKEGRMKRIYSLITKVA